MAVFIKNGTVLLPDNRTWQTQDLVIQDGKIAELSSTIDTSKYTIEETIDAHNHLIMPGLINAHAHSYTGVLKGTIDNVPLDIYMLYAIAGGSERSEREIYISAMIDSIQMLKSGITSVVDHFSQRPYQELSGLEAVMKAFSDSGMRAVIAPMFSDKSFFETVPLGPGELPEHLFGKPPKAPQIPESFIDVCEQAIQTWQNSQNRLKITLGTDGPQRCSEKLLQLTADLEEKYRVGWHTHTLEAKTQAIMSEKLYGKGLVEHLADLDMLNERSTFVHSVWLNEREMDLLAEKRATVVHCPMSNLHLGSGLAPISELLSKHVDIALGTDGGNLGNLSIFENMRIASHLHRVSTLDYQQWITASTILQIMYHGGAKAMNMNGEIGILQEGLRADLILLKTNSSLWQPLNDLTNQVVFYENGQSVDTVIVEGEILLKEGQLVAIDEKAIIEEAREIAARLRRDNRAAFERVQQQIPYFRKMYLRVMQQNVRMKRNMIS